MKRRIIGLTAAAALTFSALAGCGDKTEEPVREKLEHVWRSTEIELREDVSISSFAMAGDNVLMQASRYDEDAEEMIYSVIALDPETLEVSEQPLEIESQDTSMRSFAAMSDGSLLLLMQGYDLEQQKSVYSLYKSSGGETTLLADNIESRFEVEPDSRYGGDLYIRSVVVGANDNIYISADSSTAAFDSSMNKLYEVEHPDGLDSCTATADGSVYLKYYDFEGPSFMKLSKLDDAARGFGEDIVLPDNNAVNNADLYFADGYDVYIDTDNSVYGYNAADGQMVEICNWTNSNIIRSDVRDVFMLDDSRMLVSNSEVIESDDPDDWHVEESLLLLERIPDEELPEYYIIELAVAYMNYGLQNQIVKFNRQSEEYRVTLVDWSERQTEDMSSDALLSREIVAGNIPDMIILTNFGTEKNNWIAQGLFCDLYELMNNDESFDESALNLEVLKKFDDGGKLYEMVMNYTLGTIFAKAENVPGDSWTVAEFLDWAEALPEGVMISDGYSTALNMILWSSLEEFVDFETGECSFDGELFGRLLEFAKSQQGSVSWYEKFGDDASLMELYRSDSIMLSEGMRMYDVTSMLSSMYNISDNLDDVVMIGYPMTGGNGALIYPSDSIAICNDSLVKEGAWDFVKFLMLDESNYNYYMSGLPISNSAMEKYREGEVGIHCIFEENGWSSWNGEMTEEELEARLQNESGIYHQVSEADFDRFISLAGDARLSANAQPLGQQIIDIINEETEMYFAGEKSLEETQQVIQSRVGIYVSERS